MMAARLDELRIAVGEVEAVAAVTTKSYDRGDWTGAYPLHVERLAYPLGDGIDARVGRLGHVHGAIQAGVP
jgi:hypothetical protein